MKTIVAVASQNKKIIFEHAGKCRNFIIYTINNSNIDQIKILELSKEETLHNMSHSASNTIKETLHNMSHSASNTIKETLLGADILLTRGVGNGLIQKLARQNVACYKIEETNPDTAIHKLISGTLEAVAPVSHEKTGCNCNCGSDHKHQH